MEHELRNTKSIIQTEKIRRYCPCKSHSIPVERFRFIKATCCEIQANKTRHFSVLVFHTKNPLSVNNKVLSFCNAFPENMLASFVVGRNLSSTQKSNKK